MAEFMRKHARSFIGRLRFLQQAIEDYDVVAGQGDGVDHIDIGHRHLQIGRSEEHTSELQSLMRISYAVFCLKKKKTTSNDPLPYTLSHIHHTTPALEYM